MTLKDWADNGWLRPHKTSAKEVASLLAIVDRDLTDASGSISPDWQFGIAYNAALKLCTILLYASGYRPEKALAHYRTIQSLGVILGEERKEDVEYLETCRKKRNVVEYDYVGGATRDDVEELIAFCNELRENILTWLSKNHPHLLSS